MPLTDVEGTRVRARRMGYVELVHYRCRCPGLWLTTGIAHGSHCHRAFSGIILVTLSSAGQSGAEFTEGVASTVVRTDVGRHLYHRPECLAVRATAACGFSRSYIAVVTAIR